MIANFYLLSMHIPWNCPSLIYFECWGPQPLFPLAHHSLGRNYKWHQSWVQTTSCPHFSSGIARASETRQRAKINPREKGERPFREISFDAQLKTRTDVAKTSFPRASLSYGKFSLEVQIKNSRGNFSLTSKEFFNEDMNVADVIAIKELQIRTIIGLQRDFNKSHNGF